jgi:hypothetical protein
MCKRVGMLATLLVFVLGTGATAQEPSASPEGLTQRIEVPEARFALGLPDGYWVLTGPAFDSIAGRALAMYGDGPAWRLPLVVIGPDATICLVLTADVPDSEPLYSVVAGFLARSGVLSGPQFPGIDVVSLPAGDTITTLGQSTRSSYLRSEVSYFFRNAEVVVLSCGAESPPDDRWLSTAETFEFLSAEE